MDSPLALFWDCKNSPNLYGMDHKCSCVLGIRIRFQKVEPRLDEWAAHGQLTAGFRDC